MPLNRLVMKGVIYACRVSWQGGCTFVSEASEEAREHFMFIVHIQMFSNQSIKCVSFGLQCALL